MDSLFEDKGTVLVVDDSPEILEMLHALLKDRYHLRLARNGEQALELALREPRTRCCSTSSCPASTATRSAGG